MSQCKGERWLNLVTAVTNVSCFFPISTALRCGDNTTAAVIAFVAIASFASHLVENHKHGMVGLFEVSRETSWLLNRLDVFGALTTVARLLWLYYDRFGPTLEPVVSQPLVWGLMALPVVFGVISEYDKYNAKYRTMYLITHSIWHYTVFLAMDHFLSAHIWPFH